MPRCVDAMPHYAFAYDAAIFAMRRFIFFAAIAAFAAALFSLPRDTPPPRYAADIAALRCR